MAHSRMLTSTLSSSKSLRCKNNFSFEHLNKAVDMAMVMLFAMRRKPVGGGGTTTPSNFTDFSDAANSINLFLVGF